MALQSTKERKENKNVVIKGWKERRDMQVDEDLRPKEKKSPWEKARNERVF